MSTSRTDRTVSPVPKRSLLVTAVAVLLIAANLRLGVTSASALLDLLTEQGALTPATAVLVPSLPTVMFAVSGLGAASLARRIGTDRTVSLGLSLLAAGLAARSIALPPLVLGGTVLATAGLSTVNVLLPVVVRERFHARVRAVTTGYTTAMALGSALAAAVSVPLADALGSASLGLGVWALPALLALLAWSGARGGTQVPRAGDAPTGTGVGRVLASPGALTMTFYFALQSLIGYVVMGWLPTIAQDAGISPVRAGALLGIVLAVGVPTTLAVVPATGTPRRLRIGITVLSLAGAGGAAGMLLAPTTAPEAWAVLLGIGMTGFPLALALVASLGRTSDETARISAVAQSVGYAVATVGPLGAGVLHRLTGDWALALISLATCSVVQGLVGLRLSGAVPTRPGR